jgi:aminopeptidase-like protein
MLWVLNLSDGGHSLLDIADRSGLPFESVHAAAARLLDATLLRQIDPPRRCSTAT